MQFGLATAAVLIPATIVGHPCAECHAKEVNGFAQSGMARSIGVAVPEPAGAFLHAASGTRFTISNSAAGPTQSMDRNGLSITLPVSYTVGSGSHALGYIVEKAEHLFQSPISYYMSRRQWDMAPGYEDSNDPDFSRPVTQECLSCHADKPLPIPDTLNSYQSPPLQGLGIQCDRCHGSAEAHLRNPVPGSILNPAKLDRSARDSICEQCHLTGDVRIPNPGKTISDFQPGRQLEDFYTVYLTRLDPDKQIKVVSQAEQLALSRCARQSEGKLWCGTCHDPHQPLVQAAGYYREKCLSCHGATLAKPHAAPTQDCVGCHMVRLPAKDGGHTAFTDHRISRQQGGETQAEDTSHDLVAWREPNARLRERNLALALVTAGIEKQDSGQVIRGYRMLNRLESSFSNDPATLTAMGTILLTAKQPGEAARRFQHALTLRPDYAPYEVNLANALMDEGKFPEGTTHLERAVQLDPLLRQAVVLLQQAYLSQNQGVKAAALMDRYRTAMGISLESSK